MSIKLNIQNAGLRDHELEYVRPLVETASMLLMERTGQGAEMLGWLDLPHTYDKEEFARIKAAAFRIFKAKLEERYGRDGRGSASTPPPIRPRGLSGAWRRSRATRPSWSPTISAGGSPASAPWGFSLWRRAVWTSTR